MEKQIKNENNGASRYKELRIMVNIYKEKKI